MAVTFKPIAETFGAEVLGLNLREEIAPETAAALRDAFQTYNLLLLRDDAVTEAEQARYGRVFGDIVVRAGAGTAQREYKPDTQYVSNRRNDGILGDGEIRFHQDHLFHEIPLKGLMLYGIEIPKSGSATKFRSCVQMHKALGADLAARARDVECLHLFDLDGDYTADTDLSKLSPNVRKAWQPLIWKNPDTGQSAVWIVIGTTVDFKGIEPAAGRALLEEVWEASSDVEEYVHDWRAGDLVLWNNRMMQHARLPFDSSEARTLRRTPLL